MNNPRAHVAAGNQWVRLLYMVFFCACLYVASLVVPIIVIAQFLFALITGTDNEQLRRFSWSLTLYIKETLLYLTYNSDHKTFPFDEWPGTDELDRRVHPEALDVPAPDHPGAGTAIRSVDGRPVDDRPVEVSGAVVASATSAPPHAPVDAQSPAPAVAVPPEATAAQPAPAGDAVAPVTAAPFTAPGVEPVAAAALAEDNLEPVAPEPAAATSVEPVEPALGEAGVPVPAHRAPEIEAQAGEVSADDEARRSETVDPTKL